MKQHLPPSTVANVVVAIAPREDRTANDDLWDMYLINLRDEPMVNVLITSQGYGIIDGSDKTTTVLRHFHPKLAPGEVARIEPVQPALFGITNEYWVSFNDGSEDGPMLDRKYIFRAGTLGENKLVEVPGMGRMGVYLR